MKIMSEGEFHNLLDSLSNQRKFPIDGMFELTPICNLDCKMCYVHQKDPAIHKKILSGKQWISIMEQAVKAGMITALLTGGEAMTHPDFWMIYDYLTLNGVRVHLKSNGLLLCEQTIERLSKIPPAALDVSLYGSNQESYMSVTGHDVFDKVEKNIRKAIDSGINIRILITPSKYMMPWVDDIMALAKTFRVPVLVNSLLVEPDEGVENKIDDYMISIEESLEIFKKAYFLFYADEDVEKETDFLTNEKNLYRGPDALKCAAGRQSFAITWNGLMLPCLSFPADLISAKPFEVGFERAWKTVNDKVEAFQRPDRCNECSHGDTCNYCPVFHTSKYVLRNECKEDICYFKKVVQLFLDTVEKKESSDEN